MNTTLYLDGIGGSMYPVPQSGWVTLTDNGACFNSYWPGNAPTGYSSHPWMPTTDGAHTISVTHGGKTVSETVMVGPAPDGAPVPTPEAPGCGSGSLDAVGLGSLDGLGSLGSIGF
ncbi:hypothetical protein [Rhodococcus kronopolitis]|uniref:Uncharacterized protein n=1 Tax=Rhodococcus kronopolitis TaxID=1460226 RepID=A0ABV9FPK8_9NOCA